MKISLALSGGGFRATVFHLGALARLAEEDCLKDIKALSTVSGGSLCVGLILSGSDFKWPSSSHYKHVSLPRARQLLTQYDLQQNFIQRVFRGILDIFETRADDLSALMRQHWGITAKLNDLPDNPRWMINATCYETGKNWRFEKSRMGDYEFGYSDSPDIPVSDAMAASAGFPGLIGPLVLDTSKFSWRDFEHNPVTPEQTSVHLWDGGVYDNLGLEPLFKLRTRETKDIGDVDLLIVSDASAQLQEERYRRGIKALFRLNGIITSQVRSLRTRMVIHRYREHGDRGGYLQLGNTCSVVLKGAGKQDEIDRLCPDCLGEKDTQRAAQFPTVIRKLTDDEFDLLFRHGFEVADYTLYGFNGDYFKYIGYKNTHWYRGQP